MGANAQTSVPAFTAGQVLTAQQQTEINTGIPVFATTTTRDAAFGGTGEKTLAEGQFAYIEASNTTQYYDGAAWQTVNGGLVLVKTQTIGSAVSSVTVTNAFSATYDNYLITLEGGAASTSRALNMTLGATTTGYYSYLGFGSYTATTWFGSNNNNGTSWLDAGNALTLGCQANVTIKSPFKTDYTTVSWANPGISTAQSYYTGGGFLNNTTSYTDFTFTMSSTGTITGGTIRVYGFQNS